MMWMTQGDSLFVDSDAEVLRDALDSDDRIGALSVLLEQLAGAIRTQVGEVTEPGEPHREVIEELNELSIYLLRCLQVHLGVSDLPFDGVSSSVLDEALRPRNPTAMSQIREALRFTAINLRGRAWEGGRREWCPRCGQGWVVYAKVLNPEVLALAVTVCRECEATWLPGEVLLTERSVPLSDVFGEHPATWDQLDVVEAAG